MKRNAESADDGGTWQKFGVTLDCGTANHVNDPSVVKANGAYFMFYTVAQQGIEDAIALAVSDDGRAWQKRGVVLAPGEKGKWDSRFVGRPSVLYENEIFKMWFGGKPSDTAAVKLEGARYWLRHFA